MPSPTESPINHELFKAQATHLACVLSLPAVPQVGMAPNVQISEPVGPGLNNLFLLRVDGVEHLGRRVPGANGELDSRLTPDMLLGTLLEARWDEQGWHCRYQPLTDSQSKAQFLRALRSSSHRIHFPFPQLDSQCREQIAPPCFWDAPQELAERLDFQERHFRDTSIALLAICLRPGAIIHDPACSTGTFIAALARALPTSHCVGADRSAPMIDHATANHRLPNLRFEVADAHAPVMPAGSCDVLILRFLNAEMMTRACALALFEQLTGLIRPGGMALVFGQSSVLFDVELQARQLGLHVASSLARVPGSLQLFQFYQLVCPMPLLEQDPS